MDLQAEHEVVNRNLLPEAVRDFDPIGINERGRLAGVKEGEVREIGHVGLMFLDLAKNSGAIKEKSADSQPNQPVTPEMQSAIDKAVDERTEDLNRRITGLEDQVKDWEKRFNELQQERDDLVKERDDLKKANKKLEDKLDKLEKDDKTSKNAKAGKPANNIGEIRREADGYAIGDFVALQRGDRGYEPGYIVVGFDQDDAGNTRILIRDRYRPQIGLSPYSTYAHFLRKEEDLNNTNSVDVSQRRIRGTIARVDVGNSRLSRLRRRIRGGPPPPTHRDDIGYHYYDGREPVYVEDSYVEDDRRGSAAAVLGAGILLLLGISAYTLHEVDEIEDHQAKPVQIQPKVVPPVIVGPSEPAPKRDVPLNDRAGFFENSNKGGHGLALDTPKGSKVLTLDDGTYYLRAASGKTYRLRFNTQGKLTGDTIRALRANNYQVGQAKDKFKDREGRTYTHAYSVVADK